MPQVLHDATADAVVAVGPHHPVAELDVVLQRPLQHLVPRHGELRAARGAYPLGEQGLLVRGAAQGDRWSGGVSIRIHDCIRRVRARPREDLAPHLLRDERDAARHGPQTARVRIAAQVHVSVALHKVELQRAHAGGVVVQRRVDVPGAQEAGAVRVQEGEGRGQRGVVVDDVRQVGHCLVALVHGRGERVRVVEGGARRVDDVERALPAGRSKGLVNTVHG